jgi:LTXXQ motif family protein
MIMKIRAPLPFPILSIAAALAVVPLSVSAQDAPMMGGGMKGGDMMGGGMKGEDMSHSMMREKLSHAGDRVAALKTELKITEAQTPAWNKFADAFLVSAKSMEEAMDAMHHKMMQSGAAASLPEKLEHHAKMAAAHLARLQAIKDALDPLYASFSDEQKKLADGLNIGPMGVM